MTFIFVGLGGMIGSVLRYVVSILTVNYYFGSFPLATWTVNILGSGLLGIITFYVIHHLSWKKQYISGIGTGLIGSFTTFSTFSVETVSLIQQGELFVAFLYSTSSVIGGLFMCYVAYVWVHRHLEVRHLV